MKNKNSASLLTLTMLLSIIWSCQPTRGQVSIQDLSAKSFGATPSIVWNRSNTYALCTLNRETHVLYEVYDTNGKRLKKGSVRGTIAWHEDGVLITKLLPEVIRSNDQPSAESLTKFIYVDVKK